jgi:hypothetical protein
MTEPSNANDSGLEFTAAEDSREFLVKELTTKQDELAKITLTTPPLERAKLQAEIAEIMLDVADAGMPEASWGLAKEAFLLYIENEQWEDAVRMADLLYRIGLPASLVALANGLWLAVTYPIDTDLSIIMLNNVIEDTPANSDGAAVAAAVAHYIADIRLEGEKRESTMFLTASMLSKVAERHSQIADQGQMNMWLQKLQLTDPAIFLPRLSMVVDALAEGTWWYDKDELRAKLPVN